jgi:type VI protein secretion system component Hcp
MKARRMLALAALVAGALPACRALAADIDYLLQIDGIPGEANPPGFSDATQLHGFSISDGSLSITKGIDSSSPAIASAFGSATILHTATLGLYDDPNTATRPDATLALHDLLISSIQTTTVPPLPGEIVSFQFVSPSLSLYLELPGVTGTASPPGESSAIPIDSLSVSGNTFTIHKLVDSSSPTLQTDFGSLHDFTTASLLFYSSIATETKPDFSIVFQHALISSLVTDGGERLGETITFQMTGSAVPEPGALAAVTAALLGLARFRSALRRP